LQNAADSAAYSAAIAYSYNTGADITTQAKTVVASYGLALGSGNNQANVPTPTIIPNYAGSGNTAIQVSISRQQPAMFSHYFGFSVVPINVSAIAVVAGTGGSSAGNGCVLAMGNTATGANAPSAISVSGGGGTININAPGCGLFTNSNASNAVALNGSYTLI